jgi:hypothetical protein
MDGLRDNKGVAPRGCGQARNASTDLLLFARGSLTIGLALALAETGPAGICMRR